MSSNLSTAGTAGVRALCDRALVSEDGITVTCESHADAVKIRQRINEIRAAERKINKRLEFTNFMFGKSVYDSIETKILDDGVSIVIRTVEAAMKNLLIKDNATQKEIDPEDL